MTSDLKALKLWGKGGPNPPKVAFILEELSVPYEAIAIDFPSLKKPDFLAINPNGRMPAIQDPNTSLTLWESGAIIEYLVERYDTQHRLSFAPGTNESYHAKQWLFFQTSGQGPYFGQAVWFKKYHHEQLPSAAERYVKEINRVTGVLEGHLAKQGVGAEGDGPWLVGGRLSYADLAFVTWHINLPKLLAKEEYDVDEYPHVKAWLEKMGGRESVKKVMAESQH